jgi:hypothetical protein
MYLVDFGDCNLGGVVLIPVVSVQLAKHELELVVAGRAMLRLGKAARNGLCTTLFPHQSLNTKIKSCLSNSLHEFNYNL